MPTIKFYINNVLENPQTSYRISNPWVKFDSTTKLSSPGGLVQPLNWYYYVFNSSSSETITIQVNAAYVNGNDASAGTYPLPALNFMLTGPGGAGGGGGEDYNGASGGNGGGGGSGSTSLVSQYFSGVTSSTYTVNLYPIGNPSSVMTLDNVPFYAYSGSTGGPGSAYHTERTYTISGYVTTYSNGDSGDGGAGGKPPGPLSKPNQNFLPSYCGTMRGGAGGNGGEPTNNTKIGPGANYNGAVYPGNSDGTSSTGTTDIAYATATFADGLTGTIVSGGAGGLTSDPKPGGGAGGAGSSSFFMLYFCL